MAITRRTNRGFWTQRWQGRAAFGAADLDRATAFEPNPNLLTRGGPDGPDYREMEKPEQALRGKYPFHWSVEFPKPSFTRWVRCDRRKSTFIGCYELPEYWDSVSRIPGRARRNGNVCGNCRPCGLLLLVAERLMKAGESVDQYAWLQIRLPKATPAKWGSTKLPSGGQFTEPFQAANNGRCKFRSVPCLVSKREMARAAVD